MRACEIAYEVDLFGRVRRNIEAGRGDVARCRGGRRSRSSGDRFGHGPRLCGRLERRRAPCSSRAHRRTPRSLARLTQKQVEIGQTTRLDTARIAALRNQRQAEIPAIAAERDSALFRLATLTGRAPADLPSAAGARTKSLKLDQPIPVGDGAQLLARRPDVRAAERRLAAATARIGVATAELYPQVTLGGSLNSSAGSIGNLFSNPIGFLLGPLISWSFSDHARARARVAGAEASTQESLAQFDGTVLRSLEETETALSAYANSLRRRERSRPHAMKPKSLLGSFAPSNVRARWIPSLCSTPSGPSPSRRRNWPTSTARSPRRRSTCSVHSAEDGEPRIASQQRISAERAIKIDEIGRRFEAAQHQQPALRCVIRPLGI